MQIHFLLINLILSMLKRCSLHCPIRRGDALWPYGTSSDDRLLEMDFVDLVYEKTSPWQNIRIFRTRMSGNALFMDGDLSLIHI